MSTTRQRKNSEEYTGDDDDSHNHNLECDSSSINSSSLYSTAQHHEIGMTERSSTLSPSSLTTTTATSSLLLSSSKIVPNNNKDSLSNSLNQPKMYKSLSGMTSIDISTISPTAPSLLKQNESRMNNNNTNNQYINYIKNCTGHVWEHIKSIDYKNIGPILLSKVKKLDGKTIVSIIMLSIISLLIVDTIFSSPEHRIFKPDFSETFLLWVQDHPGKGVVWIIVFMTVAVVFMIPIGTPITVGCGYIYKSAYGWRTGVTIATLISTAGSAIGAVICFLLGRYLMRNTVRKWIRKYPLFDAIDAASAEHGLRIMAMLYLTPIVPLGPISYMCGTTSMSLSSFIIAKIAAVPLMVLYVFIGASTGALISKDSNHTATEVKKIEENTTLIIGGIVLSFVMIFIISTYIKKELNKILERQQKYKPGEMIMNVADDVSIQNMSSTTTIAMGAVIDIDSTLTTTTNNSTTTTTLLSTQNTTATTILSTPGAIDGGGGGGGTISTRRQHVRKH